MRFIERLHEIPYWWWCKEAQTSRFFQIQLKFTFLNILFFCWVENRCGQRFVDTRWLSKTIKPSLVQLITELHKYQLYGDLLSVTVNGNKQAPQSSNLSIYCLRQSIGLCGGKIICDRCQTSTCTGGPLSHGSPAGQWPGPGAGNTSPDATLDIFIALKTNNTRVSS